jgi:malonyl-CoA O-methyltransferase
LDLSFTRGKIAETADQDSIMDSALPDHQAAQHTFDRFAGIYDEHAALEQEVGSRLLERLDFHRLAPQRIVDLGCGTGLISAALKARFRKAQVIGLDSSRMMLAQLQRRSAFLRPLRAVCANFAALPLPERSSELVISNLALQWSIDLESLFAEIRRVLAPGGMLLFSSLGPGSFWELRTVLADCGAAQSVREFADILDVGNALVAAGFQEPVMDAERITLSYPDSEALVKELEATGSAFLLSGNHNLADTVDGLDTAYQRLKADGRYPVSYEIVYGAAFGPNEGQPHKTEQGDLATFSVESLRKSRITRS